MYGAAYNSLTSRITGRSSRVIAATSWVRSLFAAVLLASTILLAADEGHAGMILPESWTQSASVVVADDGLSPGPREAPTDPAPQEKTPQKEQRPSLGKIAACGLRQVAQATRQPLRPRPDLILDPWDMIRFPSPCSSGNTLSCPRL